MPSSSTQDLYQQYKETLRKIADLRYSSALLQWDQETYLPPKGAAIRGQQIATLTELAHQLFIDEKTGSLLRKLSDREDLGTLEKKNITLTQDDYSRQEKLSASFVREQTEAVNRCFHSWLEARKRNDFNLLAKDLSKLVDLKRQEAEQLGYEQHPYNALLNDYDKGSNVQLLDRIFSAVRSPLIDLLNKIKERPQVNNDFLHQHFPKDQQWALGMQMIKELGYDLDAGRQDISEHPFTINFNSKDVRITTRIDEQDLGNMVWSCIHEAGHALYEQGLPDDQYGLPLGEAASLTIHESQSRLWENHVGRSEAFCEHYLPVLQKYFPEQLNNITIENFYQGINKVEPSFIRTEADELTYHFHVMIRYELEKLLIGGELSAKDIPSYWNEQYFSYMGIRVADDKTGCLQDVHWSHGSFGYFPTYSLGSFYAAQFYATASKQIPDLQVQRQAGNHGELLQWLQTNIHQYGRFYTSEELCKKVTGETLNIEYFLNYLSEKYLSIYH